MASLWREAHLQVKMYKTPHVRSNLGSSEVEKRHAAVVRSTCASRNAKKAEGFGAMLEVTMSKSGTRLWREAHVQVKMYKTPLVRTIF